MTENAKHRNTLSKMMDDYKNLPPKMDAVQTIPLILDKKRNENFMSDLLAFILDPNSNGIGLEPLQNILEKKYDPEKVGNLRSSEMDIQIFREYSFEKKTNKKVSNRIDILITCRSKGSYYDKKADKVNLVIGIENKIDATEGKMQTRDYEKAIEEEFPGIKKYLLLLSPSEERPSSKLFQNITYEDIIKCLKPIRAQCDFAKDIRRSLLFNEFITHVEEYIMKSLPVIAPETKLYLENNNFKVIREILVKFQEDRKNLLSYITERILGKLNTSEYKTMWAISADSAVEYRHISKDDWDGNGKCKVFLKPRVNEDRLSRGKVYFEIEFQVQGKHKKSNLNKIQEFLKNQAHIKKGKLNSGENEDKNLSIHKEYQILKDGQPEQEYHEYIDEQIDTIMSEFKPFIKDIDGLVKNLE
jgi:hypothetical protein